MKKIENWDKIKVPKEKKKYAVYYVGKGSGVYAEDYCNVYLGDTLAVSEAQACNYVRNRFKDKDHPNGGYSIDILGDIYDEGMVLFEYKAKEII